MTNALTRALSDMTTQIAVRQKPKVTREIKEITVMDTKQQGSTSQRKPKILAKEAMPPARWAALPKSIRSEVQLYETNLRWDQMSEYGDASRDKFRRYVTNRAQAYAGLGPKSLLLEPVAYFMEKAFANQTVLFGVGPSFSDSLEMIVINGITRSLTDLLLELEVGVKNLSDTSLRKFGLNPIAAETFRGLAPGYAGTFLELLDTAKKLK